MPAVTVEHLKVFALSALLFIYMVYQLWGQWEPWQEFVTLQQVDQCQNSSLELPLYYTNGAGKKDLEIGILCFQV